MSAQEEVEAVLESWIQGLEAMDPEALSPLFDRDEGVVSWGVGVDERYVGWGPYETHVRQTASLLTKNRLVASGVQVAMSASQDVAWFNQVRDYVGTLADGSEIRLRGVRVTGVLEKRRGRWVVVHFHHSLGFDLSAPRPATSQAAPLEQPPC
mgnify:CR=1 FL=1